MKSIESRLENRIDALISRYPELREIRDSIIGAYDVMDECYRSGGKLLIAGNGGSAADAEHIVGELMKRFKVPRFIDTTLSERLKEIDSVRGKILSQELERGLEAISLTGHEALSTAYANDVDAYSGFAQQLFVYGKPGDVFLGISTSGNSENILRAAVAARALDIKIIGLTGASGGELQSYCDVCVNAPSSETYRIQELHLPIYHCWCLMLEDNFFC